MSLQTYEPLKKVTDACLIYIKVYDITQRSDNRFIDKENIIAVGATFFQERVFFQLLVG